MARKQQSDSGVLGPIRNDLMQGNQKTQPISMKPATPAPALPASGKAGNDITNFSWMQASTPTQSFKAPTAQIPVTRTAKLPQVGATPSVVQPNAPGGQPAGSATGGDNLDSYNERTLAESTGRKGIFHSAMQGMELLGKMGEGNNQKIIDNLVNQ